MTRGHGHAKFNSRNRSSCVNQDVARCFQKHIKELLK